MAGRRRDNTIDFQGFIQLELTEPAIVEIEDLAKKPASVFSTLADIVDDGYKASISRDVENGSIKCTLMDMQANRTSCGWMLSGQGPTVTLALAVMVYKHVRMMNSEWTPFLTTKKAFNSLR